MVRGVQSQYRIAAKIFNDPSITADKKRESTCILDEVGTVTDTCGHALPVSAWYINWVVPNATHGTTVEAYLQSGQLFTFVH